MVNPISQRLQISGSPKVGPHAIRRSRRCFFGKEWQGDTLLHRAHDHTQLRIVGVEPAIDKV
jgi:hypothetical protein